MKWSEAGVRGGSDGKEDDRPARYSGGDFKGLNTPEGGHE